MTDIAHRLDSAPERLREAVPSPYLTVEEAAQLARCDPKTIRRAFEAGRLRAFRPARRVLLREEDVRAWVESRAAVQAPRERPRRASRRRPAAGSVQALRELEGQARG